MSLLLTGIGVSRGIAIGEVYRLRRGAPEVVEYNLPGSLIEAEIARFSAALNTAQEQLREVREKIPLGAPADVAAFIDTHLLMLKDTLLAQKPIDIIRAQQCNAEWALKLQRDSLVAVFDAMEDAYLRTRRDDVDHVIGRVQRVLTQGDSRELSASARGQIVVADDLSPADTVLLEHERIAGFVTEYGGPLSHTAILARSLGIPAIVGAHGAGRLLREGEQLIIDGGRGGIVGTPDARTIRHYRRRQQELRRRRRELAGLRELPARSLDRVDVGLYANIELPEDLRALRDAGAIGVGLYRTEFLYMNRATPPDEAEQLKEYRRVLRALKGRPATIRTLDLGADKQLATDRPVPLASNPALGLRAIRRSLQDEAQFLPQLRAILRASSQGPVRLMLPMVTSVEELDQCLALIERARSQLKARRVGFDAKMPIGAMIEVPAAALSAEAFARRLDFLSIGTNDLIQYTLAIDRVDEEVNYLYNPLHPGVIRLIAMTLKAGRRVGVPVSMCGEMAGDPRYTRLLLGLGLREFSAQPAALPELKRVINDTDLASLGSVARRALRMETPQAVADLVAELNTGLD
jgi:phosphotransferase system enzyme I (PtsI)